MHRYQIVGQLGDGSFGVVSKAMHTTTGEIVAVKKMKQRFGSWEECLQLREIQSLRRLQHQNIIKLKEVVRENTELFLIFEFMDLNVYQITRLRSEQVGNVQNIFNDKEVRSIVSQTLLGLLAIHKGGFMHRDLKPENLLTKGDLVKIADFGLAKEIRSRPPFTEYVSTRWYRAPEIILRSTHYNSPIDIWACGVIFAELYLNRPLFPGASDTDQLFKICSVLGPPSQSEWDEGYQLARRMNIRFPPMAPTPLRQLIPNAPPAAVELIEQMLRFNPSDRPTTSMCLQHPFFTGQEHSVSYGTGTFAQNNNMHGPPSSLFLGISSGQPHNPFHAAAGVPGSQFPNTNTNQFSGGSSTPSGGSTLNLPNSSTGRSGFTSSPTPPQFGGQSMPGQPPQPQRASAMVAATAQTFPHHSPPSPTNGAPFPFSGSTGSSHQAFSRPTLMQPHQQQQQQQQPGRGSAMNNVYDEFQY